MSDDEIRQRVYAALASVAPEADPAAIDGAVRLRDQLDIDSMDFLNFMIAVHQDLGVEIPDADYAGLTTIDAIVAYVQAHQPAAPSAASP